MNSPAPNPLDRGSVARPRTRWQRFRRFCVVVGALLLITGLVFTDSGPLVESTAPPNAEQVGAARTAVRQFRIGQARTANASVRLTGLELSAAGALASNGFRPHRLSAEAKGGVARITGSYDLPLGRWLNVTVVTRGGGAGFPPMNLSVGSVTFPRFVSRWIAQAGRSMLVIGGAKLPPLDRLIRRVTVKGDLVTAQISLPPGSGILSRLGKDAGREEVAAVRAAYCRLAKLHAEKPSDDFTTHVRRAFAVRPDTAATAMSNRAAIFALAMLTVDPRVGEMAGLDRDAVASCGVPLFPTALNGRADISKHWALSAALAAATGTQFSQAMGEWKELADSISRQSQFAVGDPSGFSFVDLAADRSGFLVAERALADASAGTVAARLAKAAPDDLMPPALMGLREGMSNAEFVERYGDIRDPRFLAATARIDAELRRSAARRSGPLAAASQP